MSFDTAAGTPGGPSARLGNKVMAGRIRKGGAYNLAAQKTDRQIPVIRLTAR